MKPDRFGVSVDDLVDIATFPNDPMLVSHLRGASLIPVEMVLALPRFAGCTRSILTAVCARSPETRGYIVFCPDACLVLPFFVDATTLVVSDLPNCKQSEFRAFIASIVGHLEFEVHPHDHSHSFKARFGDVSTALGLWRALAYVTFRGRRLRANVDATESPVESHEIRAKPKHKKRSNTGARARNRLMRRLCLDKEKDQQSMQAYEVDEMRSH